MILSLFSCFFMFFLAIIFFQINVVLASGHCQSDQQELLLQLKNRLIFSSDVSLKLVKWNQSLDCCMWEGVMCDVRGRVTDLDLSNETILSGIDNSSSLFNLQHLQSLNLANNSFDSILPSEFDKLSNLRHLNLSHARFTGQIPPGISRLTSLVTLDLSVDADTYLGLKLENPNLVMLVEHLKELKHLYLDGVDISAPGKEWCQALSSLANLTVLSMSNCHLSGSIDSALSKLQSLLVIRLDGNNLSGPFPEKIFQVRTLKTLNLTGNPLLKGSLTESLPTSSLETLLLSNTSFGGTLPESIENLGRLSWIELANCQFHGSIPEEITNLTQLVSLDFSSNNFSGPVPSFSFAKNLTHLNLAHNRVNGSILSTEWSSLSNLVSINLRDNALSGTLPATSYGITQLVSLDFSSNNFSGPVPSFSLAKNLIHLNLAHNRLNGSILSTEWSSLSKLVSINLRDNALSGTLPATLYGIPSLLSLDLSQNQFTGGLHEPPKLASSALQSLELKSNMLNGSLPMFIFGFQSLQVLILSSNNFSGPLNLSSILNLRNLSTLDLSFNSLSINATISDPAYFPQIHTLEMASCKLKRFPNFLKEQSKLSILDLSANQIDGEIPDWVWTLTSLSYLNLSQNSLVNLQGTLQAPSSSLSVLDLRGNKLQGQLPKLSPSLVYVDYSNNNFSSIIQIDSVDSTFEIPSFIFLSNNSLHGSIPELICSATLLQVLDLSDNYLNGSIPQCLTGMESLKVLDLSRNNLSGNISDKFSSNCSLQTLNLNGNHLEGKVPRSLANCPILGVLDLGNNQINDTFPCHLKNISNLQVLVLRYNNFHGLISCPDDNFSWPPLHIVDLASNHFRGELPYHWLQTWEAMMVASDKLKVLVFEEDLHFEFETKRNFEVPRSAYGAIFPHYEQDNRYCCLREHCRGSSEGMGRINTGFEMISFSQGFYYQYKVTTTIKGSERRLVKILSLFTSIDLSCNKFEGQIPEVLGEFRALVALNLSHNGFTSLIPLSLGNLRHLESLDLSNNNLSGEIPQQLRDLNFLAVLNLSHNQLEGRIPSGNQFQTFSENSFEGNKGLCGMPLKENCSVNVVPPSGDKHSNDGTHIDWNVLSVELGFVFGLGIVILPPMLCKRWRVWYWKHTNGLLSRFLPQLNQ